MKHEEARKLLMATEACSLGVSDLAEACHLGVIALDKQIPKKPIQTHHCPNCETGLDVIEIIKDEYKDVCRGCCKPPFCKWCGQALKWEE